MEVDARELAEAVHLLSAEFPEAPHAQLESVLWQCGCDISAARRRLYELQEEQQHAGGAARAAPAPVCAVQLGRAVQFVRFRPNREW